MSRLGRAVGAPFRRLAAAPRRRLRRMVRRVDGGTPPRPHAPWRRTLAAIGRGQRVVAVGCVLAGLVTIAELYRATLAAWALHHPYFAVSEIVVSPTHKVRQGALLQWMGIAPGASIWTLEPTALERRLEEHPWIRRARVQRELPRKLTVQVVEREPAAVVLIDQLYYVDRSGVVFARIGPEDSLDLPFVTGIEAAVVNGEQPYPRHGVRQALKLVQQMRDAGLPFRVSEVHIERDEGITVYPVEPHVALDFGWDRFPEKLGRLRDVLSGFAGRETQLREVDLTYGSQVVVKTRQSGGGGARRGKA